MLKVLSIGVRDSAILAYRVGLSQAEGLHSAPLGASTVNELSCMENGSTSDPSAQHSWTTYATCSLASRSASCDGH